VRRILFLAPAYFLLTQCASPPTVEQVNAAQTEREAHCEQQGYKKDSQDFYTCMQLAQTQEQQDNLNKTMAVSTGIGLAGMAVGMLSDARAKRDIIPVADLPNGIHLYRFRYKNSDQQYVGVIAQQVATIVPDAVTEGADGYLRVNYARIGAPFMTWEQWHAAR